jgi:hypothetical protein
MRRYRAVKVNRVMIKGLGSPVPVIVDSTTAVDGEDLVWMREVGGGILRRNVITSVLLHQCYQTNMRCETDETH